jgi:hypothetical protein
MPEFHDRRTGKVVSVPEGFTTELVNTPRPGSQEQKANKAANKAVAKTSEVNVLKRAYTAVGKHTRAQHSGNYADDCEKCNTLKSTLDSAKAAVKSKEEELGAGKDRGLTFRIVPKKGN